MKQTFALLVLLALGACGGTQRLPLATELDATRSGHPLSELEQGRSLVLSKCSSCHRPIAPQKFRATEWEHHVRDMRDKAHLDDSQVNLILTYLETMADAPKPSN